MVIKVTKHHLKFGRPEINKCPLSLACQETFDLNEKLVDVSPKVLTIYNYNGSMVYSEKWPESAEKFRKDYFSHFFLSSKFNKLPKPFRFEMGIIEYFSGYRFDLLHKVVFDVNNVHGDLEYEEPKA
jgi:hypothetical protein